MGKTKASARHPHPRRPGVNSESEDEDAVEGMTVDTEDDSSLSPDSDEGAAGPGDALESDLDGDSNSNDEEPIPGEVDGLSQQTEKSKGMINGEPSEATKEHTENPLSSLSLPKVPKFGSKPKPKFPPSSREATPQSPTPQGGTSTNGQHISTPSQLRTPGSVPIHKVLVKSAPPPKTSSSISPPKVRNPGLSLSRPTLLNDAAIFHAVVFFGLSEHNKTPQYNWNSGDNPSRRNFEPRKREQSPKE